MEVDEQTNGSDIPGEDQPGRWNHVRKLLERRGPFSHENFEPSPELFGILRSIVKVLVIGELSIHLFLKNFALARSGDEFFS